MGHRAAGLALIWIRLASQFLTIVRCNPNRIERPSMQRVLTLSILALSAQSAFASASSDWFSDGQPILDLRYRYEHVTQDNALRDANAHTLRLRMGYRTGVWNGVSGLVEVDSVVDLGGESYNSTRNGRTDYAVVADPNGTAINQLLLRYDYARGAAVLGRQRINLDNQRFVGGVAWRQNEQTYDAALLQFKPLSGMTLSYAWLDRIHTVFGPDNQPFATPANQSRIKGDSQLFNLNYVMAPQATLSAYHYRLDLENAAVAPTAPLGTLSSATTGARLSGTVEGVGYAFEYARQKDVAGNPWELDSRYVLAEVGYTFANKAQVKLGQETLGGGDGPGNRAFQTPLATKHLFQGWADMFLTTPADGVQDRYVGFTSPLGGGTLAGWYHTFEADRGNTTFGNEIDVSYARPIPVLKGLTGLVKVARYDTDDVSRTVNTDKYWVQLQYAF